MSQSFDLAVFRSTLTKALNNIGRTNGHAAPKSDSNVDPLMHEYDVASVASSYFERRRKEALERMLGAIDQSAVSDAETRVTANNIGEEVFVASGKVYDLVCTISKPSERLDEAVLRATLMRKHKLTQAQVAKLIQECTKATRPAKRFRVVAHG